MTNLDRNIDFRENRQLFYRHIWSKSPIFSPKTGKNRHFFAEKLQKSPQNRDHNIDPGCR
jgi:DNA primase catalytic subunit